MKLIFTLLISTAFLFLSTVYAYGNNNNTMSGAETLALNGMVNDSIGYNGDTANWYKVRTNADGDFFAKIYATGGGGDGHTVTIAIYDTSGALLITSFTPDSVTIEAPGLAEGTFYIKITPWTTGAQSPYILSNSLAVAPLLNDKEPNNNYKEADALPIDANVTGHIGYYFDNHRDTNDWYKLILPVRAPVNMYFYAVYGNQGNNGTALFIFYDSTAVNQLTNGESTGDTFVRYIDTLPKGTYYIKVTSFEPDGGFTPYMLGDSAYYKVTGIAVVNNGEQYWQLSTLDAGNLLFTTNFTAPQNGTIEIINSTGQIVKTLPLNAPTGLQRQIIFTGDLVNGYYFIRLVDSYGAVAKGFVKTE